MPTRSDSLRLPLAILALLVLLLGFGAAGTRGLYETTEGRFAEAAREMLETGEYLEPQLAYEPHFDKPPLAYWAIDAGMAVFGANEFGARAANGAAFVISVLAVMGIGRLLWDRTAGVVSGLVYATSLFVIASTNSLSTDTLLTLFELLFVLAWFAAVKSEVRSRERLFIALAWLALGLGVLTKGTAALVPLAPALIWDFVDRRPLRLFSPVGFLLFGLVGLGWYALVVLRNPGLAAFIYDQQVTGRLFSAHYDRNWEWYQPLRIYLPLMLFGCGPWIGFAFVAWRRGLLRLGTVREALVTARPLTLLVAWIVPPLVVFSLAKSRLPLYVLPITAPVALGLARALCRVSEAPLRVALQVAVPTGAVAFAGLHVAAHLEHKNDMRALYQAVEKAAPRARVFAYDQEALHGLRFYLRGALTRLSSDSAAPWMDEPLEQALATARGQPSVFVTRRAHGAQLERELDERHIPWHEAQQGRWTLIVTDQSRREFLEIQRGTVDSAPE